MKFIERLAQNLRSTAAFNPDVQDAPACILWTDRDRQWESIIPYLREVLPELFVLGEYKPVERTGPAIWLRCVIARTLDTVAVPENCIPILYLPGVGRQQLRAVESCHNDLKPLAELQYRGVLWSQVNAKDWTILAFLKSDQGGLGLDPAQDNDTKDVMPLALYRLLDEEIEPLKGKRLDKDYFNTLITGGDPARELLQWLDQGEAFTNGRSKNEWKAFIGVCESKYAYNPQTQGRLEGASRLAMHKGPWQVVWDRFCEAPARYPNIPALVRQLIPPVFQLFEDSGSVGGWPQWNDEQENQLRTELKSIKELTPQAARGKLLDLEREHRGRRKLVWTELGESPLALALEHLNIMAQITQITLTGSNAEHLAAAYRDGAWRADNAVIQALALVEKPEDLNAVTTVIRELYLPWAQETARYLQQLVDGSIYPGGTIQSAPTISYPAGECILFVDGLRFDCAQRLVELLKSSGCNVDEKSTWAALPSVTATGKPAVSPVRNKIRGGEVNTDFEPYVAATGQSLRGGYHLKKLLIDDGWQILEQFDSGDSGGKAWCSFGDIDSEGHKGSWKLAKRLDALLYEIRDRILALLNANWNSVRVVTDHGWLLMPDGLPKIELSSAHTDSRGGRCAVIKPDATTEERFYPWFWNPNLEFALANGISCFRNGLEYAHGGLSLQECVTLELNVTREMTNSASPSLGSIDIVWKRLRCTVVIDSGVDGLSADIRTQPADERSSVVVSPKSVQSNGTASLVVENEDLEGCEAIVVILDVNGRVITQAATVIGGGRA